MAKPFKQSHDLLVAGLGREGDYDAGWQAIAKDLTKLVKAQGFDPAGRKVPEAIRAKIVAAVNEPTALRAGAMAAATDVGVAGAAGKKRALGLKTLRHLYYHETFGKQRVWILSLPKGLGNYPMEFQDKGQGLIDQVLATDDEIFPEATQKDLAAACQMGLAWVQKALIVAGAPTDHENRKLFRRWFVPAGTAGETAKITAFAVTLRSQLLLIADGLKKGEVILTDSPHERGKDSKLEKSEAFVYTKDDLIAVHIEKAFFSTANTLTGKANWARIMVHELSHCYAKTEDHSYSWQGLLPRDDDTFKSANDRWVVAHSGFPAVRALTMAQCQENADSWAFFIADCAGALAESARIQALGQRLYDSAGETMAKPMSDRLKQRAA